jgi:hypothetical protein
MVKFDSQKLLWVSSAIVYGLTFGVIAGRSQVASHWSPILLGSFAIGFAVGFAAFIAIAVRMATGRS